MDHSERLVQLPLMHGPVQQFPDHFRSLRSLVFLDLPNISQEIVRNPRGQRLHFPASPYTIDALRYYNLTVDQEKQCRCPPGTTTHKKKIPATRSDARARSSQNVNHG